MCLLDGDTVGVGCRDWPGYTQGSTLTSDFLWVLASPYIDRHPENHWRDCQARISNF